MREGVRDLSVQNMDLNTTEEKLKWANEIAIGLMLNCQLLIILLSSVSLEDHTRL